MIRISEKALAECEAIYSDRTASFTFPKPRKDFVFGDVTESDYRRIHSKLNRMKNSESDPAMKRFIQSMIALFIAAEQYQGSAEEDSDGIGDEGALERFRKLSRLSFSPLYPRFLEAYND